MTKVSRNRLIYGMMAFVLLLQYLWPLTVLAEALTAIPVVTLNQATVAEENEQLFLTLKGTVQGTGQEKTAEIDLVNEVALLPQDRQALTGVAESEAIVAPAKITLTLAPESTGDFTLKTPLDAASVKDQTEVILQLGNQTIRGELPQLSSATATEAASSDSGDLTGEMAASSATSSSESAEESTKAVDAAAAPSAKADEAAHDIRDYFTGGSGTIITDSELTYVDENGVALKSPVPADATVNVHYDWVIPEDVRQQIKAGDYFTFHLPAGVEVVSFQSGELKNEAGEVYAEYTVAADGTVTIIFNERVTQESEIHGSFDFKTEFDKTVITGPGDVTITYPAEDKLPPVNVTVRPSTDTSIAKKGHFDRTPNPTNVTWEVDFNQGMEALTDPTVTEHWPNGLTYQSVVVYQLVMNLDGSVASVGEMLDPSQYTVDPDGNVTIKGTTSDAYRIEYVTMIDDSAIPGNGGKVSFTNTATLTDAQDPDGIDAKATVTNTYGKLLAKNQAGYDKEKQEFSWEIKYNYGEKKIPQNQAVITDTISDNMDFIEDSLVLHEVTFDSSGKEQIGRELTTPEDYTLEANPSGKGFVIKFTDDVEAAVKISYKTSVDGLVTDPTAVDNKVNVATGEEAGSSGTAQQQNVIKSYDNVNYADGMMDWTIKVNQNKYYMEHLTLTDTYDPVPGLSLGRTPTGGYQMTITNSAGQTLTYGTDYQLTQTFDNAGNETGFKIVFLGNYDPTEDSFTIKYTTNFDITLLDPEAAESDHFSNEIRADWQDESGGKHQSGHETDFRPNPNYSLNAEKSGAYNAQTKEITWTMAVNLSRNLLQDAYLTDQIKDNQSYVAGSLKIYEATTQADGTVVKNSDTPVNSAMMSIQEPAAANAETLQIHFPDQSQHTYLIEFKTSVADKVIESSANYENVADYTNQHDDRQVIGEVSVKNGGTHVQKSGVQDPADPDYVNWNLVINPAQSTLSNVKVTDHPSANQILDQNSIAVYQTKVAADGTITPDLTAPLTEGEDYLVTLTTDNVTGEQVLTVEFLHEISTAYYLEYRSLISSSATGSSDVVSNQVDITGEGSYVIKDTEEKEVTVSVNHSGGSAAGTKGKITLKKTAEDQTTSLAGAHFQLWNTTKTQILREGDVDPATGEITFGNLILGEYLLVETQAPDGYTIPDDLVQGRRITITSETSSVDALPTVITNTPNKVILTKMNDQQTGLAGAEFSLERKALTGDWQTYPGGPYQTDAQGRLEIDSLPLGEYRLIETKAPAGHLLDATPISFVVTKNGLNQIPTINLKKINYQGSAQLLKKDEGDAPLAGAVFKVVNSAGETVKADLVSDGDGRITVAGLAPGDYRFVETQAPSGYLLNETAYPFTIQQTTVGKPLAVKAGTAVNYQGAAELKKTDANGKVLAGAVFKVVDNEGQTVKEGLTADDNGQVKIDGLAPGKYAFIETQAPAGYLLNTTEVLFEIAQAAEGQPAVVQTGTFKNYQGSVKIHKVDTAGKSLAGAEFALFDAEQKSLGIVKTSPANGWVQFDDLAPGTYYLQEVKAPALTEETDYVINPYMIKVVIPDSAEGQPQVVDLGGFQNFKGKAEVTKEGSGSALTGAHFDLYVFDPQTGAEHLVKEVISAADGSLDLAGLGAGNYKLVETVPAPGYILNTQPIYFVVDPKLNDGPVDQISFENYQSVVEGIKVSDSTATDGTEQLLAGAEFQVYEQNGDGSKGAGPISFYDQKGQPTDRAVTGTDGKIFIKGLPEGEYLLVETKAPAGYILNTAEIPFVITPVLGEPEAIELDKVINYQGKFDIAKVSEADTLLEGGRFVVSTTADGKNPITVWDHNGQAVTELSAVAGHITASGLTPGTYYLVEVEAPTGFVKNTKAVKIEIPDSSKDTAEILFTDTLVNYQGSGELIKKDEHGQLLAGAEFKVVDQKGETLQSGLISGEDGKVTVTGLAPGSYRFIETKAPAGYLLNETPIDFTISKEAAGQPQTVMATDNFINYHGSAELIKKNEQGQVLAGAEFKIVDQAGQTVQSGLTSDQDGKVLITDLAPGSYQIIETKAPVGYLLNETPIDFTISKTAAGKPELVLASDEFINYQGSAELIKKDEAGQVLAGAKFKVVDQKGETLQSGLLSGKDGKVTVTGLAPGSYQFIETKAPAGYLLNETPIDFTIAAAAADKPQIVIATDNFINYQGQAELIKVDQQDQPLAGAKFKVVDETGSVVREQLRSDDQGRIKVAELAPGNYAFIETQAPAGYVLNETPIDFTIAAAAKGQPTLVAVGRFANEPVVTGDSSENPTGSSGSPGKNTSGTGGGIPQLNDPAEHLWQLVGVLLLMGTSILYYFQRRKRAE